MWKSYRKHAYNNHPFISFEDFMLGIEFLLRVNQSNQYYISRGCAKGGLGVIAPPSEYSNPVGR